MNGLDLSLMCEDAVPSLFGILDPAIAPALLYYSYIPIIVISLLFGFFVFLSSHKSLAGKLLPATSVVFSILLGGEILLWISAPVRLIHFVWEIISIFHVLLIALTGYFVYVFSSGRDLPLSWKWIWTLLMVPIFLLVPTEFNLQAFDLANCESIQSVLWIYIYFVEALITSSVLYFCLRHMAKAGGAKKSVVGITTALGAVAALSVFILSYALGDIFLFYNINLFGPIGMVALLAALTYLIVRFQAFNLRIIGAQALVGALVALLFAALFVRSIENVRYVLLGTLILVLLLGTALVRGVLREIQQRERIEQLAKELEKSNKQQIILIHFITHQVKGFMTKSRNIFSLFLDGDYGQIPDPMRPMIEEGFRSDTKGVNTIQEILNAANIKSGKVTYDMTDVDLKAIIDEVSKDLRTTAEAKGLVFKLDIPAEPFVLKADRLQLLNAFKNLIDNSIKYTPKGSVTVSLRKVDGKIRFMIEDTGVGICDEDKERLFTEGGHGVNSQKVNVESTGFGLYIVKNIIEAHHGKVWAESEGEGKGARFIAELPV